MGPLSGLRILDLTRLLPGPYATRILADLGADVLKIEPPEGGDYARWVPPVPKEQATFFSALNHNKRSIRLNLKVPQAVEIFWKLLDTYDVVLEQFRPGVMDRLGIGYEKARERFPWVIYVSLTGYGQDGPMANRAGHDLNYIGLAGVLGLTGTPDGRLCLPGAQLADLTGALNGVMGTLAAVFKRERTGEGDHVDVSLAESALNLMSMYVDLPRFEKEVPGPAGMRLNGLNPCYNVYPTKDDRWMSLGALEPKFWAEFVRMIERPDLIDDGLASGERGETVKAELTEIFRNRTQTEWVELIGDRDVCCEPVLRLNELEAHPLWAGRGSIRNMDHPTEGSLSFMRPAARFDSQEFATPKPSPGLGEHTDEVLGELGYDDEELAALAQCKAI